MGRARLTPFMTALEVKEAVRQRDGYRCVECGMPQSEHLQRLGKALEVHRLTPGSPYTLLGCVTLCRRCHGRKPKQSPGVGNNGRMMVLVTRLMHRKLKLLAKRNSRPLGWEVDRILTSALQAAGFAPDA